ncbi:hypothetical protein Pan216_20330 [Planctomycetes bacterium Pan216]|uniref:Globin-sensor domain-containing protein n=1 Tax=Kolteria novifilia TaxID=2527975 RepID=A0A518B2G4_9BACT|nr:hypothetical protein Pan216_20330 [Planctomycetes bacterium Pan216]
MRHIDEQRLNTDLEYRYDYLSEFMGFSEDDVDCLHELAQYLAPAVPALVDAVYDKLFEYDATKRHFAVAQHGYDGPLPEGVASLSLDDDVISFRKQHLGTYLAALVTRPYDSKMVTYLDNVGRMHTIKGGRASLQVPLVQMNALLGFVSDALIATLFGLDLDIERKQRMVRAVSKLLWLQNDLINRHYAEQEAPVAV